MVAELELSSEQTGQVFQVPAAQHREDDLSMEHVIEEAVQLNDWEAEVHYPFPAAGTKHRRQLGIRFQEYRS